MREAIGGTWMLGVVVLFIVLFSAFLALSINYTKAFKVKNEIINMIEDNHSFDTNAESTIQDYLDEMGYTTTRIDKSNCDKDEDYVTGGYCVRKICDPNLGSYYKVRTFVKIELPIVYQTFTFPINGETKLLQNDTEC